MCHWFPSKRPSDYLNLDSETSLKIDIALAAKLEEEHQENRFAEIKLILEGMGVKFKPNKATKTPQAQKKKNPADLPPLSTVMSQLMGNGGVVIE